MTGWSVVQIAFRQLLAQRQRMRFVWAFVARLLYTRKRHEAESLRERLLAEEHKAREALESKNQQLEEELATLRHLKAREYELQFELFVAQLTPEDLARLEHEAQAEVKPHIGLSPAFQMDMHRDSILKQWFAQRMQLHQEHSEHH